MARFKSKYTYSKDAYKGNHVWTVVSGQGAVHLHISDYGQDYAEKYDRDRYTGGIEMHYRNPPSYMKDDAPSQDECWILKCPCWHDGSSLQAVETWIPRWVNDKNDHDGILASLEQYVIDQFQIEED